MLPLDKKILLVDDDATIRGTLKSSLLKFGFKHISEADDVVTAKKLLLTSYDENNTFDLILCDHHMPGNTGLDFITYLRSSIKFREIAFITITSDAQRSVVLPYLSAGSDSFIVKPFNEEDLQSKIIQVWTKRGIILK